VRTRKLRAGKTLCHRLVLCVPIVAGVATRFLLNRLYGAIRSVGEVMYGEDGERRHLTVLFCDLVGSPEIAAILIPRSGKRSSPSTIMLQRRAIERFGGHVAQYLTTGDSAVEHLNEVAEDNPAAASTNRCGAAEFGSEISVGARWPCGPAG
jgi:class 3 adenylate cyclase